MIETSKLMKITKEKLDWKLWYWVDKNWSLTLQLFHNYHEIIKLIYSLCKTQFAAINITTIFIAWLTQQYPKTKQFPSKIKVLLNALFVSRYAKSPRSHPYNHAIYANRWSHSQKQHSHLHQYHKKINHRS